MKAKRCLVIGDINIDFAIRSDQYPQEGGEAHTEEADFRLGGSACATAVCLQRAGLPTALAATLGEDVFADFALGYIRASGLDPALIQQDASKGSGFFMIVITPHGGRTMFGHRGANALPLPLAALKARLDETDHLHCSGYSLLGEAQHGVVRAAVEYAHQQGVTVSLDPGVCSSEQAAERILDLLPLVDWFLPNRGELAALTGNENVDAGAEGLLALGTGAVVVKLDAEGALYASREEWLREPPAAKPEQAVWNTTGAGDCFNAGFLKGMLSDASPQEALHMGNAAAFELITSKHGLMDLIKNH